MRAEQASCNSGPRAVFLFFGESRFPRASPHKDEGNNPNKNGYHYRNEYPRGNSNSFLNGVGCVWHETNRLYRVNHPLFSSHLRNGTRNGTHITIRKKNKRAVVSSFIQASPSWIRRRPIYLSN